VLGPDFLQQADWKNLDGQAMTPVKWNDPALEGFSVTIPGGLTIRMDRRKQTVELQMGAGA
jgi:hypothetical protein